MIRRLSPGLFLCAVLAGCGGGGGSTVPQAQPSGVTPAAKQRIAVSITVPGASSGTAALKRHPLYVSIATQSVTIAVNGGTPVVASLAANSLNCTPAPGGGRVCTIVVSAPVGMDTFTEATFASTNGTGTPLSTTTSSASVVSGVANVVNLVLGGVVASIQLSISNSTPSIGTVAQLPLTVTFQDASNYTIIGNDQFASPITITDSDLSNPSITSVSKTPLKSPADAYGLFLNYNGQPLASPAVLSASVPGVPKSNSVTVTPQSPTTVSFVDWPTYGYDSQRSGFNPFSTAITPASVPQLHLAWQMLGVGATQTQPIVVTNVVSKGVLHSALLIIGSFAIVQAYDALTGQLVWHNELPVQGVQDCGIAGVSGTVQYVRSVNGGSIFVAAGTNGVSDPNHTVLYRLDAASGVTTGQVDIMPTTLTGEANYSHTGITYANGRIYLGTGSDCEGTGTGNPSWRGRVVSVDPTSMALLSTFFTTYGQGPNSETYGGGGVWAWGGVSADQSGNVYVAAGNAENLDATGNRPILPPFVAAPTEQAGYGEHLIKLSADLTNVEGSTAPTFDFSNGGDLDYTGTPVVYQTSNCGTVTATQGKAGTLVINNAQTLNQLNSFALSVPDSEALYMGNPAYWPKGAIAGTGSGYLYAAIASSGGGSLGFQPGLAAIDGCGGSIAWKAAFGPDSFGYGANGASPRSAPTVTAGGVVLMGTPCTATGLNGTGGCAATGTTGGALWAVDATTGTVLGNSLPILHTPDMIRMAPTVDGQWVYVLDGSGNFYGLTTDTTVPTIAAKIGRRVPPTFKIRRR